MLPIPEHFGDFFPLDSFFSIVHLLPNSWIFLPVVSSPVLPILLGSYLQTVKKPLYYCFNIQEVGRSKVALRVQSVTFTSMSSLCVAFPIWVKWRLHAFSCWCPNLGAILDSFSYAPYPLSQQLSELYLRNLCRGFPGGPSVWGSICQCRGHGFDAWFGKIPPAVVCHNHWACTQPVLCSQRSPCSEKPVHFH